MSELDMTKAALEAANEYIQTVQEELSTLRSTLDREREAFEKEAGSFSRRYAQDRVTIAGWIKSYEDMFDKHTSIEKELSYERERVGRLAGRNQDLAEQRDELESTLATVYEQMEFYKWYWECSSSSNDPDDLQETYYRDTGRDIPEEAWE